MKARTPTKVELAMAVADLALALHATAGAAHYNGQHDGPATSRRNTGQWRLCRRYGCTTMLKIALFHADTIEWARATAPTAEPRSAS